MNRKQAVRISIDILMTLAMLLLMAYELIGQAAHEWIGVGVFVLFITHHILNNKWCRNILKGRYTPYRVLQTVLVIAILVLMLIQMISGITLSRHIFTFLFFRGLSYLARSLHMLGAYWSFVLMSLHLGIHWNMMMAAARKAAGNPSKGRTIWLRAAGIAVAGWGVFAFIKRQVGEYLMSRIQFAFFDFEEPVLFFLLDYLAVMGLFVWIGHYLAVGLRKISQTKTQK